LVSICTVCGNAVAASVKVCYACDTAVAPATPSARGAVGGRPTLSVCDFTALERFARLRLRLTGPVYAALLSKLEQSRMLPVDAAVPDVASLGSRVVFSVDGGQAEARVLVLPTQHSPAGWTLPVTTPRGLALLGHVPGTVVTAVRQGGAAESLRLLAVTYQPDAAAAAEVLRGHRPPERTKAGASAPPAPRRIRSGASGRSVPGGKA
jgi:regulator of nucleoside diphosphate kinase